MHIFKSDWLFSKILLSGLLIAFLLMFGNASYADNHMLNNELLSPRILGEPDAPITLHEFSSLTCPHCAKFHREKLPKLKEEFIDQGILKLVYHEYPLDSRAEVASLLARCLPEDTFFPFIETLYSQQSNWVNAEEFMPKMRRYGLLAGLSRGEIDACFSNQELYEAILDNKLEAEKVHGIRSTPSFLINDRVLSGNQDYQIFAEEIQMSSE